MSNICRTSDSALRCNSPEITFAQFSELQLNRQKPELIQALFIFLSIYLVLQIFCSNFAPDLVLYI